MLQLPTERLDRKHGICRQSRGVKVRMVPLHLLDIGLGSLCIRGREVGLQVVKRRANA